LIRLALILVVVLCAVAHVLAVTATATAETRSNFSVFPSVLGAGGGFVCGAPSYDLLFTLGEVVVGASSSDSLFLWSGFWPPRHVGMLCPPWIGVGEPVPEEPSIARLCVASPNPAMRTVRILYEIGYATRVRLAIYDVLGREVRVLHEGPLSTGTHEARWDGCNDRGVRVAAGVYYAHLTAGSTEITERLVILR
jgi:hypothetical protein